MVSHQLLEFITGPYPMLARCLLLFYLCSTPLFAFTLKPGDLLFQDLECGPLCNAIFQVTHGYNDTHVSHVGMVVEMHPKVMVIEAIGSDVHLTPLKKFLDRSLDKKGKPRVMVGRLDQKYRALIPNAIKAAKSWIGRPYNSTFMPNIDHKRFYCSQLIYDAFEKANDGKPIFVRDKMNYKDPQTDKFYPVWKHYFTQLKHPIPQGKWGTNPGKMSRSPHLKIIHFYGELKHSKDKKHKENILQEYWLPHTNSKI